MNQNNDDVLMWRADFFFHFNESWHQCVILLFLQYFFLLTKSLTELLVQSFFFPVYLHFTKKVNVKENSYCHTHSMNA